MQRIATAVLSAATVMVAAFGLSGCGGGEQPAAPAPAPVTTTSAAAAPVGTPLPPPEALTDVLYRLADVNVPGPEKVNLVEQASADDADALGSFGRALADNGFEPVVFEAHDLGRSQADPDNVVADVVVTTPDEQAAEFTYPMEFTLADGGWQLTRSTAETLLALSAAPPTR